MRRLLPLAAVAGFSLACSGLLQPQTFHSADGRFELTVPAGFRETPDLHDQAALALSRSYPEAYVVLLADERVDTVDDVSFEERALAVRAQTTEGFTSVTVADPVSLTIDGHPAMRMAFAGEYDGLDLAYVQTAILTDQAFVQVVMWGLTEQVQGDEELAAIGESFRQSGTIAPNYLASLYGETPVKAYRSTEDVRIQLGGDWGRGDPAENPDASLLLAHERLDMSVMVISEPIEGSEITDLAAYRTLVVDGIAENVEASRFETADPVSMQVNGLDGLLTAMEMDISGYRFAGMHLTLQSETRFHQLWIWGPKSQMQRHDAEIRAALESFEEIGS